MIVSDAALAAMIVELYGNAPQFDDLLQPEADDGVCLALRRLPAADVIVLRGSVTGEDFARDALAAIPFEPFDHARLGTVPLGFWLGMESAFAHVSPLLRRGPIRTIIAAHSLGGPRGTILGGLLLLEAPDLDLEFMMLGSPRPGGARLCDLVRRRPFRSYRNAGGGWHDLFTDVPTDPPNERPTPLLDIYRAAPPDDPWGPFRLHHSELYAAALAAPAT